MKKTQSFQIVAKNGVAQKKSGIKRPFFLQTASFQGFQRCRDGKKRRRGPNSEEVFEAVWTAQLKTIIDKDANGSYNPITNISTLSKYCSSSTLEESAKRLARYHKPKKIDFKAKFGIQKSDSTHQFATSQKPTNKLNSFSGYYCAACKKNITETVAKYCWQNKNIFQGRAYCYNCQKQFKP